MTRPTTRRVMQILRIALLALLCFSAAYGQRTINGSRILNGRLELLPQTANPTCGAGNYWIIARDDGTIKQCQNGTVSTIPSSGSEVGAFTQIASDSAAAGTCDGGVSYADVLTATIPSGTLAVGDAFTAEGQVFVDGTGAATRPDAKIQMGGNNTAPTALTIDDASGANTRIDCVVVSLTSVSCMGLTRYDAFQTVNSTVTAVSDLSANALDVTIQERNCQTGDTFQAYHLTVNKKNF